MRDEMMIEMFVIRVSIPSFRKYRREQRVD